MHFRLSLTLGDGALAWGMGAPPPRHPAPLSPQAFFSNAAAAGLHDDCGPPAAPSHSSSPQSVGGNAAPGSRPAHYPNLNRPVATLRRWPLCLGKRPLSLIGICFFYPGLLSCSWGQASWGELAQSSISAPQEQEPGA